MVARAHVGMSTSSTTTLSFVYVLTTSCEAPAVDASRTIGRALMGRKRDQRLMRWTTNNYWWLVVCVHSSMLAALSSWVLPVEFGRWLALGGLVVGIPPLLFSALQLNTLMLCVLIQQYEFWLGSALNTLTLGLLVYVLKDERAAAAVLLFAMTQLLLMLDANFQTVRLDVWNNWLWLVAITGIAYVCLQTNFAVHKGLAFVSVEKLTMLINAAVTLFALVANKATRRRHLLCGLTVTSPSAMCRASLMLLPAGISAISPRMLPNPRERGVPSALDLTKRLTVTFPTSCTQINTVNTVVRAFAPHSVISQRWLLFLYTNGVVGLISAGISLLLVVILEINDDTVLFPLAIASISSSTLFCSTFAFRYQRDLLSALLRNFDFWFPSLQFIFASVTFADLLRWDYRCLNVVAWIQYFLFVLLVDAISPTTRCCFRFRKTHALPVLLAVTIGIIILSYDLFMREDRVLENRVVRVGTVGSFSLSINTTTFLAYRLLTIFLWTVRLTYHLVATNEHDLVLLRGTYAFDPTLLPAQDRSRRFSLSRRHSIRPVPPQDGLIAGVDAIGKFVADQPQADQPTSHPLCS